MTEFAEMVSRYLEGSLAEAEVRELHHLLDNDATLREAYVSAAEMHGRLKWELGQQKLIPMLRPRVRRRVPLAAVAAALAIIGGGWLWMNQQDLSDGPDLAIAEDDREESFLFDNLLAVGRIIHVSNARWGFDDKRDVEIGEWLTPGGYELERGEIVIALDVGGTMKIEGPAVFGILNKDKIRLRSGGLQARFEEPGQGFTVITNDGAVVDLGTEFRVSVNDRGAQVQVIEGKVRAEVGHGKRELTESEGLLMTSGGFSDFQPPSTDALIDEFRNKEQVAYYRWGFEETAGENFAASGSSEYDLTPYKPGRLPERIQGVIGQALRFSGTGEFLVSPYKGVSGSQPRTIAAWVRIPKDAKPEESYGWAAWGKLDNKGNYLQDQKWQVSWNPQVRLKGWTQPLSPGAVIGSLRTEFGPGWVNGVTDLRDGKWHHVVSIFIGGEDPDVATHIRHYVDGRLEGTSGYQRTSSKPKPEARARTCW